MPIIHNLPYNAAQTDQIYLRRDASSGPDKDLAYNLGAPTLRWAGIYAQTFFGISTTTQYADVAERFSCADQVSPGDIVVLGGEKEVCLSTKEKDIHVFGVVSAAPALGMNHEAGPDDTHPFIALSGRVPCKILGSGKKGQRLVTSEIPGVARAIDLGELPEVSFLCIIGRLLEDKEILEVGLAMVLVGVK